jgi:adenine-specific DNA-methyltransferase
MKIFRKYDHKIILGEAIEVLSEEIQDNSIDLIFADPPYNTIFQKL